MRAHGEHQWMAEKLFTDWWGKDCCGPKDCFRTRVAYHDCDRPLRSDARCMAVIELRGKTYRLSMTRGSVHFYSADGSPWVCGQYSILTVGHSARCLFIPRSVGMGESLMYGMTPAPVRHR